MALCPSKCLTELAPRSYRAKYGKADRKAVDGETRELFAHEPPLCLMLSPGTIGIGAL
jgi:hypothetical protein